MEARKILDGPLQLEPETVLVENGDRIEQGAWIHVSLEQVGSVFPHVKFGKYCETPRHKHNNIPATMFQAVFYTDRVDTWLSCWDCFQLMHNEL